jgi:poly(A) polymerase
METVGRAFPAPPPAKALLGDTDLAFVLSLLDRDGESARLVGGALRNALLARPVHEFDIATTASPDVVTARARKAGVRCVPTGLDHGTVTVVVSGRPFEVTSLREDVETDGRRAKVRFSRDFAHDAQRRDFTVNALSMSPDGTLFDYVGGLEDIAARRVRFIGEPIERIREDYLRILRFFRFTAEYAVGPLDRDGLVAAMRERDGLARLSRERIRAEILKLLAARRAGEITEEICQTGLLGPLLAMAPNPARFKAFLRDETDAARDPLLGLAALCINLPEDARNLRERLRLSNAEETRLVTSAEALVELHGLEQPPPVQLLLRLLFRYGRQAASDALTLARTDAPPEAAADWNRARLYVREAQEPHMPFSGADLLAQGVPSGRAVGVALKDLQARWIEAGFTEDPRRLAELLGAAAKAATEVPGDPA